MCTHTLLCESTYLYLYTQWESISLTIFCSFFPTIFEDQGSWAFLQCSFNSYPDKQCLSDENTSWLVFTFVFLILDKEPKSQVFFFLYLYHYMQWFPFSSSCPSQSCGVHACVELTSNEQAFGLACTNHTQDWRVVLPLFPSVIFLSSVWSCRNDTGLGTSRILLVWPQLSLFSFRNGETAMWALAPPWGDGTTQMGLPSFLSVRTA